MYCIIIVLKALGMVLVKEDDDEKHLVARFAIAPTDRLRNHLPAQVCV